jgi:hypothetical protein
VHSRGAASVCSLPEAGRSHIHFTQFRTAGQKPHLYFSRFNNNASAPNVELMRVQIEFDK